MMFIGILVSVAAIGVLCWLLFTLAVFALPVFAGITAGVWAFQTGAGWVGGIVVGLVAAGLTLGIGQLLLAFARRLWLRVAIKLAFAAPASIAGYHVMQGIVQYTTPSEAWQTVFSGLGAIAIGVAAVMRISAMAPPGRTGQGIAST